MVIALGVAGAVHLLPQDPRRAAVLSEAELEKISPWLGSAYRSRLGLGTVFFGTVVNAWSTLDPEARALAAETIREELSNAGVQEVFLFDTRNLLLAHFVGEQLRGANQGGS